MLDAISLLTISAAALSYAIGIREGLFCLDALLSLTICVITTTLALFRPEPRTLNPEPSTRRLPVLILLVALALQFSQLFARYPGSLWNSPPGSVHRHLSVEKDDLTWIRDSAKLAAAKTHIAQVESSLTDYRFQVGILLAAALTPLALLKRPGVRHPAIALILVIHFLLGVWLIRHTPNPFIDVHVFQKESAAALLHGQNPYSTTFTNIYGPGAYVYAPNLMKGDRVNFGYPYPPLTLFMALPGHIAGDYRYSQLAAVTLAGLLLMYARPGMVSTLAALLLLFTPRVYMIVEMGWTEPFVVLLLAFTLFCAARFPRATPCAFGLLLASKQYMVFAIPLAALLMRRREPIPPLPSREKGGARVEPLDYQTPEALANSSFPWRDYFIFLFKSLLVAAVVSLPLALWNLPAFIRSAVTLQLVQPFRKDSISYLAWIAWYACEPHWLGRFLTEATVAKWSFLAFVAAAGAIIIVLKRCPRTPAGFALGMAVVYLAFLALNKQAFCNYYFFVIGALCATLAVLAGSNAAGEPMRSGGISA